MNLPEQCCDLPQAPTLVLRCEKQPDHALRLTVEAVGGGMEAYLRLQEGKTPVGMSARDVFASDDLLVDSWMVFLQKDYGAGQRREDTTLQFLQAVKGWVLCRLVFEPETLRATVSFQPPVEDTVTLRLSQLMGLKQRLWLDNYVAEGGGWEIDLASGTIFLSRPLARLLGIAQDAVIVPVETFLQTAYPEDVPLLRDALQNVQTTVATVYSRSVQKDGGMLYFNSFAIPGYDEAGNMARIIGQSRDITRGEAATMGLEQSERRFRGIVENSQDLFVVVAPNGALTYVSPNVRQITGYDPERAPGVQYIRFIAYKDEEIHLAAQFESVLAGGPGTSGEYLVKKADGSVVWFLVRMSGMRDAAGHVSEVVAVCRDITGAKLREERLEFMSTHDALTGLYNRFHFENELDRIQREDIVDVGLVMADLNGLKLINDAFGHHRGDELLAEAARLMGQVCAQRHDVFRVGGDEYAVLAFDSTPAELERICECVNAEVKKTAGRDIPLSLSWGVAFRGDLGQSMQALYETAEGNMYGNKLLDSRSMRNQVLASLKETLRVRNLETADHTQRMENMVVALGKRLGLSGGEFDKLVLLASMHDIGKVAIPDDIINKPGGLSVEEWGTMRTHSEIGYRIAMTTQELAAIADEIGSHHERWDGKGYPRGEAGEDIPLLARIIGVVDAYDVMTHKRVYKQAQTHDEAIAELRRCAGTQFDPAIVGLFLDIFGAMSQEEMEQFVEREKAD